MSILKIPKENYNWEKCRECVERVKNDCEYNIKADERAKAIEELNELKEEIKKLEYYDFEFNCALLAEEVYDIIDKRISELMQRRNE